MFFFYITHYCWLYQEFPGKGKSSYFFFTVTLKRGCDTRSGVQRLEKYFFAWVYLLIAVSFNWKTTVCNLMFQEGLVCTIAWKCEEKDGQICISIVKDTEAAGSFYWGNVLHEQFNWLLVTSHFVWYTGFVAVFIDSSSMFAERDTLTETNIHCSRNTRWRDSSRQHL